MDIADRTNGRMGGKYRGNCLQTENDLINIGEELAGTEAGHVTLIRMGCHSFFDQSSSTLSVLSKLSIAFKSLPEVCNRLYPGGCHESFYCDFVKGQVTVVLGTCVWLLLKSAR